jgi:uncharacterized repeat protein (TIGR01451 family)
MRRLAVLLAALAAAALASVPLAAGAAPKPKPKPVAKPAPLPAPTPAPAPAAAAPAPKLVTFVARFCPTYKDVTANLARNNIQESLQDLGADTLYASGQPIEPEIEERGQPACRPLPDWTFTLGTGYRSRAVAGTWGSLSIVTGSFPTAIATKAETPLLNAFGESTGRQIEGAVTIALTQQQADLASRANSLWTQGGTITDPVLDEQFPQEYGFAALRCAIDNLNGDNVEWIAYPSGARHVFCYAYYVKPPPTSGTIVVRKVVSSPAGATQQFRFTGNISYAVDDSFTLSVNSGAPASTSFYRAETKPGEPPWDFKEDVPPGWKLDSAVCASQSGASVATVTGAKTTVRLAAGDVVTCIYTNSLIPPPGGLSLTKTTIGGTGTFDFTVTPADPAGTPATAVAKTTKPGVEVPASPATIELAPGTYTVAEKLPAGVAGTWKLTAVECNGAPQKPVDGAVKVTIASGQGATCAFENTFVPAGEIVIRKIAFGRTGTAGFGIYDEAEPKKTAPAPYTKTAKVTKEGVSTLAVGDATNALQPGSYRIQEFAAGGTDPAGWALTSVVCNGKTVGWSQGAAVVKLTAAEPKADCTFTNTWTAPETKPPVEPPKPPVEPPVEPPVTEPAPKLTVTKTADRHTIVVGDLVTYTITVKNVGDGAAQGVRIAEQTPTKAQIVSVTPSQGTCDTSRHPVACNLGTIDPGKEATVVAVLRATTVGPMANAVSVGSNTVDPEPPTTERPGVVEPKPPVQKPKPKPPVQKPKPPQPGKPGQPPLEPGRPVTPGKPGEPSPPFAG